MNDAHIHGIVRDSFDKSPIQAAKVLVVGTKRGALTDINGVFHLHELHADSVVLRIIASSYDTTNVVVPFAGTDDARIEVLLVPHATQLSVRADRIPNNAFTTQAAKVITTAELDEHRGQTFADALTIVPGVTVLNTGPSISKPVVHGLSGTRLVLRNNGVAQEGQQWGAEHAPEIDPFSPAKITLVKGPSAVMYGPNAMGGAIDVEQRHIPLEQNTMGEAILSGYSNNAQASVAGLIEQGHVFGTPVSYRLQGSIRKAGDAATPQYRLANTAFEELSGTATLYYGDVQNNVSALLSRYATELGIFKGSHLGNAGDLMRAIQRSRPSEQSLRPFSYSIENPHQEIAHTMFVLQSRNELDSTTTLRAMYSWQKNDRSEFDAHNKRIIGRGSDPAERAADSLARLQRALLTPAMNLVLSTYNAQVTIDHALSDNVKGSIGMMGTSQVNDRAGSVYLVPDYRTLGWGVFAYESMTADDWMYTAGLRFDARYSDVDVQYRNQSSSTPQTRTFSGVSGGMGASWHVNQDMQLYANIGLAWRPPQMNELFGNDVHHGVAYYEIGDSSLTEERNVGLDVGWQWNVVGTDIDISAYYNVFNGYIVALPDPTSPTVTVRGTFPTYRFAQHAAALAGLDVSVEHAVTSDMNLYAKGSAVRGNDNTLDQPLFMIPADRLKVGVHIHTPDAWGMHDLYVDVSALGVRTQDRYVVNQDYLQPPPGYVLAGLDFGGTIDMLGLSTRLTCTVNNFLDQAYRDYMSRYRYFADDVGRDVILRWKVSF